MGDVGEAAEMKTRLTEILTRFGDVQTQTATIEDEVVSEV